MNDSIPEKNGIVLKMLYDIFKSENIKWILTCSAGLAIRGIDVEVNDIDLIIFQKDLDKIQRLFGKYAVRPMVYKEEKKLHIRSFIGTYNINGVQVEIMSEVEHETVGIWKRLDVNKTTIKKFNGMDIVLLTLESEYEAYKSMGRLEKARKIREVLK